jgi:hypothetical protein
MIFPGPEYHEFRHLSVGTKEYDPPRCMHFQSRIPPVPASIRRYLTLSYRTTEIELYLFWCLVSGDGDARLVCLFRRQHPHSLVRARAVTYLGTQLRTFATQACIATAQHCSCSTTTGIIGNHRLKYAHLSGMGE